MLCHYLASMRQSLKAADGTLHGVGWHIHRMGKRHSGQRVRTIVSPLQQHAVNRDTDLATVSKPLDTVRLDQTKIFVSMWRSESKTDLAST